MRSAVAAVLLAATAAVPLALAQPAPERSPLPQARPDVAEQSAGDETAGETATDEAGQESGAEAAAGGAGDEASGEVETVSGEQAAGEVADAPAGEAPAGEAGDAATVGAAAGEPASPEADADATHAAPAGAGVGTQPAVPATLAESDLDFGTCLGRLAAYGTVYEEGRAISEQNGACGIARPLRVTQIVPGVALVPSGIMRCETAAALAEWVAHFVLPASSLLPERGRLVEVMQGTAYLCRNINGSDNGNLSEHAFGNAVDIMGFRFASGAPIPIQPREREGSGAEAFQRTVRAAACLSFSTVLGPGQPAHDDHLHLDVKARSRDYRLCQ